jgi:hypothetical protein
MIYEQNMNRKLKVRKSTLDEKKWGVAIWNKR